MEAASYFQTPIDLNGHLQHDWNCANMAIASYFQRQQALKQQAMLRSTPGKQWVRELAYLS
jgi:hypothetical protein